MPELIDVVPGAPEWLAARRAGITATDLPAILGISPYESPYSLYYRKLGAIPDVPDCPRFALGRYLEPYIAQLWCDSRSIPPAHREGARSGLYRSTERPWQLATLDRLFYDEPVELKSWADMDRDRWDNGPPATVRAQVLWQMDVMGVTTGHVAVLFLPSGELRSYVIEHASCSAWEMDGEEASCPACNDLCTMSITARDFYRRMQGELPPPDADGSAASLAAARARFTPVPRKVAIIDPKTWAHYTDWDDELAQTKTTRTRLQIGIRELAGDCGDLEVDGQLVARFDKRGALRRLKQAHILDALDHLSGRIKAKEGDNGE